ncbi:MAG TPA: FAD-binding oxidoreductase [Candidatus Limnocylindrales bacterium]|nr:FAD-binding oxidoreductase [Candidatus Limnocylindrales bacterium]
MARIVELRGVREQSYWQATMPELPDRRSGTLRDSVDVVVIGGGITGLSAARRSAELGASVVLLEAERLGWGASTRNGGMCHPGFKTPLSGLVERYGRERGERLYRESIDAYEHLAALCEGRIEADFRRSGHVVLASAPGHATGFADAARDLTAIDMPSHAVAREDLRQEVGSDAFFGGLVVERSGGLHPGKLVAGLVRLAEAAGATLHEETRALHVRRQADGRSVVETSRGAILARDVIVATNGYTGGVTPSLRRRLLPISSYIIVTEPLAPDLAAELIPHDRMLFDTKHYLWYWRRTPDDRLLFGGRASMWPTTIARTASILRRSMVDVHPQLAGTRVEYAWGGKVAFTFDRMVHAGRADGVTYATGCCGSGVAIMPWLGTRIAEWVGGGAPPEIASLSFPLVPAPYEGRTWFLPIAGEYWKAKDRRDARTAAGERSDSGV